MAILQNLESLYFSYLHFCPTSPTFNQLLANWTDILKKFLIFAVFYVLVYFIANWKVYVIACFLVLAQRQAFFLYIRFRTARPFRLFWLRMSEIIGLLVRDLYTSFVGTLGSVYRDNFEETYLEDSNNNSSFYLISSDCYHDDMEMEPCDVILLSPKEEVITTYPSNVSRRRRVMNVQVLADVQALNRIGIPQPPPIRAAAAVPGPIQDAVRNVQPQPAVAVVPGPIQGAARNVQPQLARHVARLQLPRFIQPRP